MDHKYLNLSGLKLLFYTKVLKLINLKIDKTNGDISDTKVRSVDTITAEFPDPVAGESTKTFLGKVKKCLADWKAIKSTLLTLSMLTNQHENSTSKIPTAALVYALNQSLATTNSNLVAMRTPIFLGRLTTVGSINVDISMYREIALYIRTSAGEFLPPVIVHTNLVTDPLRIHPTMFYGTNNYLSTTVEIWPKEIKYISSLSSASSFESMDSWGIK